MPAPARTEPVTNASSGGFDPVRGALWMVLSCLGATAMSVAVRFLSGEMETVQIAFLRSALGLWVILPMLLAPRFGRAPLTWRLSRPWLHLIRGLLFVFALNCGFYALATLPLATATTLFFLAPVFATVFAALFTGERVGPRRWSAVGAAFLGALIILRPGFAALEWGMVAAVGSSVAFSASLLLSRPAARADGAGALLVSSGLIATLAMAVPVASLWVPVPRELWGVVAALVLGGSLRMYADIRAYAAAEAGFLAPFAFLRLLFIAAAGWLFFREGMDGPTLLGAGVIVGAAVFIARREAQLRRAAASR